MPPFHLDDDVDDDDPDEDEDFDEDDESSGEDEDEDGEAEDDVETWQVVRGPGPLKASLRLTFQSCTA